MAALLTRLAAVVAPPFCWGCGADTGRGDPLCRACRGALRWLGGDPVRLQGVPLWSAVAYEGPARALVRALKYRGAPGLADPLAAAIAAGAPRDLLEPGSALVPVPMPAARRRRRGYNQAERIATALGRRTGLDVAGCLERGAAARQVGRGRQQRLLEAASGVRAVASPPRRALLVDDVATTGATLAACATALRRAGTGSVAAVT
ncbi:MAG TPA: hypothetical protein VFY44_04990, partial [Thermoleophilaceae bacterium]|nr:hypothetical protein [Thermoleophilaceae bacterium]